MNLLMCLDKHIGNINKDVTMARIIFLVKIFYNTQVHDETFYSYFSVNTFVTLKL